MKMDAVLEKENKGKFQSIKNLFKSDSSPKVFVVSMDQGETIELAVYAKYKDANREFKNIIATHGNGLFDNTVVTEREYFSCAMCLDGTKVTLEEKELIGG